MNFYSEYKKLIKINLLTFTSAPRKYWKYIERIFELLIFVPDINISIFQAAACLHCEAFKTCLFYRLYNSSPLNAYMCPLINWSLHQDVVCKTMSSEDFNHLMSLILIAVFYRPICHLSRVPAQILFIFATVTAIFSNEMLLQINAIWKQGNNSCSC